MKLLYYSIQVHRPQTYESFVPCARILQAYVRLGDNISDGP